MAAQKGSSLLVKIGDGASPENVENYLNSLFFYCDMGDIFTDNWDSLEYQENLYQQLASAPIEPIGIIDN